MSFKLIALAIFCVVGFCLDPTRGCKREPANLPHGTKRSGDNGYHLYIGDEPKGYQPGKIYNGKYTSINHSRNFFSRQIFGVFL